ncbi:MAG: dihydrodipicolinate synthase family protein [Acidimicrobiaceae bacterium]|nr:dihydrodipicolinate synthase family protein [Acidimicrobiaceae bacterium]
MSSPLSPPNQSLDLDAVNRLISWQLANGTDGISVGGSTGEPTSQTVAACRSDAHRCGGDRRPYACGWLASRRAVFSRGR